MAELAFFKQLFTLRHLQWGLIFLVNECYFDRRKVTYSFMSDVFIPKCRKQYTNFKKNL